MSEAVTIADRVDALDLGLFDTIMSQSDAWDRRALLALHAGAAAVNGRFTYLEIGSYLGGSLQAVIRDPRCERVISIDPRPEAPPDVRTGVWSYEENSTEHMVELLRAVPEADIDKLATFQLGTDELAPDRLPATPDYCFIDGEHTNEAVLRDARFCAAAMRGRGVIAFHDRDIVRSGIREFAREVWTDVSLAIPFNGLVFALELGDGGILRSSAVRRAIASTWHWQVWTLASRPRRSDLALFAAWSAVPVVDRAIAALRGAFDRRQRR